MPPTPSDISNIVHVLMRQGVIAHPADTCYGLAGDFLSRQSVERTQAIKGRDAEKPMSIMLPLSMKAMISDYALLDEFARRICDKLLPGPVTLLLPKGASVPAWYYQSSPLIGIRIPNDALTQEILEAFGGPLITTSANLSGQPPCLTGEEVRHLFEVADEKPDLILEGAIQGDGQPSTVILVKDGKLEIVRKGPITEQDLAKIDLA